jgi:hypothetical protein
MLKDAVVELACNEVRRMQMGENLKQYLDNVVSWNVVAEQYNEAHALARQATQSRKPVMLPLEF